VGRTEDLRVSRRRHQWVFGKLQRAEDKIEFIQVRHEEMAAFMASAHAKFTGELGVCIATSGPGAAHLVTGLYDARLDHMPVLAITGQQATDGDRRALSARGRSAGDVQGRCRRLRVFQHRGGAPPINCRKILSGPANLRTPHPFSTRGTACM